MNRMKFLFLLASFIGTVYAWAEGKTLQPVKEYRLWYDVPPPNRGGYIPIGESDRPLDFDWENYSLPIGNGHMGVSVFGTVSTERLQITDKTLYVKGLWKAQSNTSFAELYLDFFHNVRSNYRRELLLNEGISTVSYECDGVNYVRKYFVNYPDNVLVIKLTADKIGKLTFTVRPQIPHTVPFGPLQRTDSITKGYLSGKTQTRHSYNGRTGNVSAQGDLITLRGATEYLKLIYEAQIKVIPYGGTMSAHNDSKSDHGTIHVENADSAVILLSLGTNYQLKPEVFERPIKNKLDGFPDPHQEISKVISHATQLGYNNLLERHKKDFSSLFNRVQLNLGEEEPMLPTDGLLAEYKQGKRHTYLEELMFHYGRYLLISSSRKGSLPPTLQGVWNQYELAPWNGNYTHNINIQMNYWLAFNTNLIELFENYVDYFEAYRPFAEKMASQYVQMYHPEHYSVTSSDNGWAMGIGSDPYHVGMPSGHSGPGVGAFTAKLFWDYYLFTGDKNILKEITYPAISGQAKFLSKVLVDTLGCLLASPSASPEQYSKKTKRPYMTVGCAFDQEMIYENHRDVVKAAGLLHKRAQDIQLYKKQMERLNPIQIGASGQIKEYREEKYYGDIVLEQNHRHVSHLVALYPGTLINGNTPAWLDAVKVVLNRRGDFSTGWSMAHKLNLWARAKEGNRAHDLLETILKKATLDNLWTNCIAVLRPTFQIDANFGTTAGIAEMLLQSHEEYIDLLPALPEGWGTGDYKGLTARGNYEVSAKWKEGKLLHTEILSKSGNRCVIKYPHISQAILTDMYGKRILFQKENDDKISFKTLAGEKYFLTKIPSHSIAAQPGKFEAVFSRPNVVSLKWQNDKNAAFYQIYRTRGNNPDYELIASDVKEPSFSYVSDDLREVEYLVFKIVMVDKKGNRSKGTTTCVVKNKKCQKNN